ncbi:MAG: acyl-CoA dehydrogenase family protein, partial [Pyrinomonadaceae bacterium]
AFIFVRVARAVGLPPEALRAIAGGQLARIMAGEDLLDLGPAPGAGADPTMLLTRATRGGDGWSIEGPKWYITGADGAAFAIVMARSCDDPDPRRGATMFLADMPDPAIRIERTLDTIDSSFVGGHAVIKIDGLRLPAEAVLGEVGHGFRHAQVRLAPARLTHCMRWLGA